MDTTTSTTVDEETLSPGILASGNVLLHLQQPAKKTNKKKNAAIGCLLFIAFVLGLLLAFCFSAETGGFNTTLMSLYNVFDPATEGVIYRSSNEKTKRSEWLNIAILTSTQGHEEMTDFPWTRMNRHCYGAKNGHKILLDTINYLLPEHKGENLEGKWNRLLALKKWLNGYDWILLAEKNTLFINHDIPIEYWIENAGPGFHVIVPQIAADTRLIDGSIILVQNDPLTWNFLDMWWKGRTNCPQRNNLVAMRTALLEIAGEARGISAEEYKSCHSVCDPEENAVCFNDKIQDFGWTLSVDRKTGAVESGVNHPPLWFTHVDTKSKDPGMGLRMEDGEFKESKELFENAYTISYQHTDDCYAKKLYHNVFGRQQEHCLYDTWAGHTEDIPSLHRW